MVNRANGHRANDHSANGNRADVVAPAARPFLYLDANHEMQSLKWRIGSKIRLKWTVPWFSVFVDQTNLKKIWKFSLSQYRCHKTPIDVENCVKSQITENKILRWLLIEVVEITNWGARLPHNRFGWRWLLFEELWTPSLFRRSE